MTALVTASGNYRVTAVRSIDRAIRLSTAAAVLAVAGIAAYVSYWHAYAVVRAYGGSGITARLEPATIDGLVYASSMVILYAARHRIPAPPLARWLLGLGIAATLTANMAQGWSHGPVGAIVAAWPAVSLVGSYELLVWLIRTSRAPTSVPPAGHPCENAGATVRCVPPQPQPLTASSTARATATCPLRAGGRRVSQPTRSMVTGFPELVPIIARRSPLTSSACKLAIRSERKLAQMFGRTSRRWARARITEARQSQ